MAENRDKLEAAIKELKEAGVRVTSNWKPATVFKKLKEARKQKAEYLEEVQGKGFVHGKYRIILPVTGYLIGETIELSDHEYKSIKDYVEPIEVEEIN